MKRQWKVERTKVQRLDGQRRWDIAYQRLLQWASENREVALSGISPIISEEAENENCDLRACIDLTPTTEPKH